MNFITWCIKYSANVFLCLFALENESRSEYIRKIENIWKFKHRERWNGKNTNNREKKYPRQLDATDNKRIYIGIFVQLTCRNVCIRILFARSHSNVTILWMTYVLLFFCRGYWLPLPMILFVVLNSLNFYSFASHEWNWSRGGANLPKKGRERGGDREKMKWKKNRKWEEK